MKQQRLLTNVEIATIKDHLKPTKISFSTTILSLNLLSERLKLSDLNNLLTNYQPIKQYIVKQPSKFKIYLKRNWKHEWTELKWLDKKWSVSIERRDSLDYNAMLSIKIVVNQSELGKRTFMASFRINPQAITSIILIFLIQTSMS